jgi:tetratricopeptide (TPR) repeat protein
LKAFNYVISKKQNNFTEQALAAAAEINMKIGDYNSALSNYKTLDSVAEIEENIIAALTGQMQTYLKLNKPEEAIKAADRVLKKQGIPQETERQARFITAKSYMALNQKDKAAETFKKLATDVKNSEGAEAKFRIAEILFDQGKQDKAQKEIFSFIDMNSPHQYWVAKAYILLASIYHNKKDDFQAVNTLQSIIDNYDKKDDGIIKEAQDKKDLIEGKNAPVEQKSQDEDPEIGL